MKKRICLLICTALLLTGCGAGSSTAAENPASQPAGEAAQNAAAQDSGAAAETPADPGNAGSSAEPYEWNGYLMPIPDGFEYDSSAGMFPLWNGKAGAADAHIVINGIFGYDSLENAIKDYTLQDVPGIMDSSIAEALHCCYKSYNNDTERMPENTSEADFLGTPVMRETGKIKSKTSAGDITVSYAAYFGKLAFSGYDGQVQPSCWIVFSDSEDADTVKALESIADTLLKEATAK